MGTVAVAAVLLAALYTARHALVLVYLAVLLAVAISPAVRVIERNALRPIGRFRLPRTLAILLLYVAVLGTVAALTIVVATPVANQVQQLWNDLPSLLDRGQRALLAWGVLREPLSMEEVLRRAPAQDFMTAVTSTGFGLVGGIFGAIVLIVLVFYLLVESRRLFEEALELFAPERRPRLRRMAGEVTHKVSAWLGGHVLLGTLMGASTALVLGLAGLPYYYVLAVLSFVGEFLPYVGPLLCAVPGVLIAVSVSWTTAFWVALFFLVQQQIENQVLVPQVFERQVGLGATMVIVAILIGAELHGILGVVLAVPSAAIVQVIVEEVVGEGARDA